MKVQVLGNYDSVHQIYGNIFKELNTKPSFISPNEYSVPPEKGSIDILLTSLEWSPEWRTYISNSKRNGIPVLYVMDGVIEWSYIWNNQSYVYPTGTVLQPLISDNLSVIGRHQARILSSMGLGGRISITGLPRLDEIERSRVIKADRIPRIVISTAKTYAHNTEQEIAVKSALRDLINFFSSREDITAIWRIPNELAKEFNLETKTDITLADELRQASALISFTSTCILEGMLIGIPTAQVEYRPTPLYLQTTWVISSKCHIEQVVHELLNPPANKIALQDYYLEDELEPGEASKKLADLITNIVDGIAPKSSKLSLSGKMDYRLVHPQISSFSIEDKAVLQYELDGAYRIIKRLSNHKNKIYQLFTELQKTKIVKLLLFISNIPGLKRFDRIMKRIVIELNV